MAFDPSKYTVAKARPLPVILLLDRSGSMAGEKISTLNVAVNQMIESFKSAGQGEAEINLAVISFGGDVSYDIPLQPVAELSDCRLQANGGTPMGAALSMAKDLLEDKERIPSKCYRPAVVLVSDGAPTDEWEKPMDDFVEGGRSSKCQRFAMAIGTSQDDPVLNRFMHRMEQSVYLASDATKIRDFFQFVTMSVSQRSRSQNPNALPPPGSKSQNITDLARGFGIDL